MADKDEAKHQRLLRVQRAAVAEAEATEKLRKAVTAARSGGASWAEIGRYLGVSRQAATKRFGEKQSASRDEPTLFDL